MTDLDIDQLVLVIVSRTQSKKLMAKLNKKHFFFTIIDSSSSLFKEPTVCLILGLNHRRMNALDALIQKYCQPYTNLVPVQLGHSTEFSHIPVIESQEGGATIYGMTVEHFEQV